MAQRTLASVSLPTDECCDHAVLTLMTTGQPKHFPARLDIGLWYGRQVVTRRLTCINGTPRQRHDASRWWQQHRQVVASNVSSAAVPMSSGTLCEVGTDMSNTNRPDHNPVAGMASDPYPCSARPLPRERWKTLYRARRGVSQGEVRRPSPQPSPCREREQRLATL